MARVRSVRLFLALALATVLAATAVAPAAAQSLGRVLSPILTLDRDRLFSETEFGQRVNRELEAASNAMAAESRKIEAALEEEERQITAQRETLDVAAFRELAREFDEKVQALRQERETVEANLLRQIDEAQADFFERIGPVLGALVRERGAVMILDRRAILLSATNLDITDAAVARIDAVLGDGTDSATTDDAPAVPGTPEDDTLPVDSIPAPGAVDDTPMTDDDAAGNGN